MMRVKKRMLRGIISEIISAKAPPGYYDPPDTDHIPDEIYDDLEVIFDRAATSPNGTTDIKAPGGYYSLEDDSLDGEGQYILTDPHGVEQVFYANDKTAVSNLEDRIINVLMSMMS